MSNWMKLGLGLLAGTFAGGGSIAGVEMIGHSVAEGDAMFGVASVGLGIAAFVGGTIGVWISKMKQMPWIIALILAGLSLMNVFTFKHPVWFVPVAFTLLVLGAWLASRTLKTKDLSS